MLFEYHGLSSMMFSLILICLYFGVILADVLFIRGHYLVYVDELHSYDEALRICAELHNNLFNEPRLLFIRKQFVKNYLPHWLERRNYGKKS